MTRQIPSYLRVHRGEESRSARAGAVAIDDTARFWQAYTEATGWRIDRPHGQDDAVALRPAIGMETFADLDDYLQSPSVPEPAAQRLAEAAVGISARLQQAEATIRRQEAEIAAGVSLRAPAPRQNELASRLEAILADGAEAAGCEVAALYLLDDDTSQLRMHAAFGLPTASLLQPPRPLRGALADLEALLGNVVAIEDAAAQPQWQTPESLGAALCAVVTHGDLPLGTLWLGSENPRAFSAAEKAAARLTARNLAVALECEALQRQADAARQPVRSLRRMSAWQQRQLPPAGPLADGWQVSGWTDAPRPLASSWHHWDILPDGTMALVIAEAHGDDLDAALIAATTRAAWQAHAGYRHHPAQMLGRVGDTLWQTNTGDQLVSLLYLRLDPETGEGQMAAAGEIGGMIVSRYGFRPLREPSQPLGSSPDLRPANMPLRLQKGEVLLACTPALLAGSSSRLSTSRFATSQSRRRGTAPETSPDGSAEVALKAALAEGSGNQGLLGQQALAEIARAEIDQGVESLLAAIRRGSAQQGAARLDRTVLAVHRTL